ncbi:hypothetical protein N7462_009125 [Penicillium macrosclerotiorum]|uniref:uncharacterized protein n=1 Tax=Penicillium macrosclerotiorum TaxID=303699 RepID=UPI0025499D50|nr:uncharacterized protein N7462_009125 [Penicillium macrosclerotiorum]KAJ5676228.1 hypothetical protein N7462_009125 [Penicillium macrosclerotiorum]
MRPTGPSRLAQPIEPWLTFPNLEQVKRFRFWLPPLQSVVRITVTVRNEDERLAIKALGIDYKQHIIEDTDPDLELAIS